MTDKIQEWKDRFERVNKILEDTPRRVYFADSDSRHLMYCITVSGNVTNMEIKEVIQSVKDKLPGEYQTEDIAQALYERFGYSLAPISAEDIIYY